MTDATEAKKKILIVEDEELLLGILSAQFSDHGFEVVTARDGQEGLQKYFADTYDAAIIDVIMPKMDGIEMLAEIHKRAPEDRTPCLVLSNSNDIARVADAIANKAVDYLVKSNQHLDDIVKAVERRISERAI